MAVRKILIQRQEDGALFISDAILYEGKLWLVPEWLTGPSEGTQRPARIICLADLPLAAPSPQYRDRVDMALSTPLSREILEGRAASQSPLVIERPELSLTDADFHR